MSEGSSGYMKGGSGRLFWLPAAVLALFFTLRDLLQSVQSIMTYNQPQHPVAVLASAAAWALALTAAWAVSYAVFALRTSRRTYMAAFFILAAAALVNFVPTAIGSYYVTYVFSITYHAAFPFGKVALGLSAAVCLMQAAAYGIFLFTGQGNTVIRIGSAIALLCALAAMLIDMITLTGLLARISPVLANVMGGAAAACNNCAAFGLLAAMGGMCFGKPKEKAAAEQ